MASLAKTCFGYFIKRVMHLVSCINSLMEIYVQHFDMFYYLICSFAYPEHILFSQCGYVFHTDIVVQELA